MTQLNFHFLANVQRTIFILSLKCVIYLQFKSGAPSFHHIVLYLFIYTYTQHFINIHFLTHLRYVTHEPHTCFSYAKSLKRNHQHRECYNILCVNFHVVFFFSSVASSTSLFKKLAILSFPSNKLSRCLVLKLEF